MTRTLLTTRTRPVRRPTEGRRARPVGARPGSFSIHGPLIQRQDMAKGTAGQPAGDLQSRMLGHAAPGRPLPETTRIELESRFGADFSAVRIHTDGQAAQISRALNARALTIGNDIFFERASYAPGSAAGARLLAHELSHVVQQRQGEVAPNTIQRAAKEPAAVTPAPTPPVDCAAEITSTRTCGYLINEMSRLRFDMHELDTFIERYNAEGNVDAAVAHTLRKAELQTRYNEKERVRAACCPGFEVPPVAPFAPATPPAAPSASPQSAAPPPNAP